MTVPRRVMWNGTVRSLPLAEQLLAARLAGCTALSLTPADHTRWLGSGISTRDMLLCAADAGVTLHHLDPFARWVARWQPEMSPAERMPLDPFAFDRDDFFRIAGMLEVESFTALAAYPPDRYPHAHVVDAFGLLCAAAAVEGLRVDLEPILGWGVPDVRTAWAVVDAAGAPNSGIMLDLWSHVRSGQGDEPLRAVPSGRLTGVQLCDGLAQVPDGMSYSYDALFNRRLPGSGDWPVQQIVEVLGQTGGLLNVGLEIFAVAFDAMPAEQIGAACRKVLDGLLGQTAVA